MAEGESTTPRRMAPNLKSPLPWHQEPHVELRFCAEGGCTPAADRESASPLPPPRPLPEFTMPACRKHFFKGHFPTCRECDKETERQFREACEVLWALDPPRRPENDHA